MSLLGGTFMGGCLSSTRLFDASRGGTPRLAATVSLSPSRAARTPPVVTARAPQPPRGGNARIGRQPAEPGVKGGRDGGRGVSGGRGGGEDGSVTPRRAPSGSSSATSPSQGPSSRSGPGKGPPRQDVGSQGGRGGRGRTQSQGRDQVRGRSRGRGASPPPSTGSPLLQVGTPRHCSRSLPTPPRRPCLPLVANLTVSSAP